VRKTTNNSHLRQISTGQQ
jgi:hypothetical protein